MQRRPAARWGFAACTLAALLLGAEPANAQPVGPWSPPAFSEVELPGERLDAEWALPPPEVDPLGLVLLQHGFSRRCAHLRPMAATLAEAGWATLCLNADMARGNPLLAKAWAERLLLPTPAMSLPDGRALPERWIVAGHSAGAAFALDLGVEIRTRSTGSVVGALLLDPVSTGASFEQALRSFGRPVSAVMAAPGPCNASGNALAPLEAAQAAGADVRILPIEGGTHVDAEGEATDFVAVWACRQGAPRPEVIGATRRAAVDALRAMILPPDTRPAGDQPATRKGTAAASSASGASSAM